MVTTKTRHPDYVHYVMQGIEGYFEYTPQYLVNTIWEAPVGLIKMEYTNMNSAAMKVWLLPGERQPPF